MLPRSAEAAAAALLRSHDLPDLGLAPDWRDQPRLWGHSFHPMCSYLGSFPAALAHGFIGRFTRPGDVVLDPFAGRGTVPLQACVSGRIGAGSDANPLANILTAAKVDPPQRMEAEARLARLAIDWSEQAADWLRLADSPAGALIEGPGGGFEPLALQVSGAFHPRSLAQVLFLRRRLDAANRTDRFLIAALLGILHGRSAGYVSDAMPNGFSLAPGSTTRALAARAGSLPERDVLRLLGAKLRRLYRDGVPRTRGVALAGDARGAGATLRAELRSRGLPDRARLVITSPPYLRTLRYGSANWLRLWFLGADPADVDRQMDAPSRPLDYVRFIGEVLAGLRETLTDDAVVALVIGDVATDQGRLRRGDHGLAAAVWEGAAEPLGFRIAGAMRDAVPANRKLTRLWGVEAGRATDTERILVLGATEIGRRRALASLGAPIDWAWPPRPRPLHPILGPDAADVSPRRSRGHGSARAHEESRPRADDLPPPELRAPAAGPPVRA
ncbi:MAG: hypothetical protein QOH61_1718 [Chloroflexota bacterium]|jgi:site-specific DNA-methyltransferase (adenine-specific)|nr:hypothetical protein [Chloroflexota bacterium]